MNRHLIVPVVAITIAGATAFAVTQVSAHAINGSQTSLVQKVAQRFNLSESDVQSVFDEARTEHQAEMKLRFEQRLTQAVENGTLTEDQKQAILDKHKEIMAERDAEQDSLKEMTPEERRAHHETERAELEAWADSQGIDLKYFMPLGRMGGRHMGEFKANTSTE